MKKAIRYILLTVCVCVFCYSAYNLINIYLNYKKIDDDYGELAKTYTEEKEEKESYLQINWDELLQRNKDVKAWIQIPNTNVNYPVLQGETNDTYIHSDIDHNELSAGSIFIASENEDPFNDFNTVIYGHNMKNGSMFNNIKSYTDQSFADEHPYVYIYLPDGTVSQYKVVVGHIISESSVLYSTQIVDTASFVQEMVKTSSIKVDFDQSQVQSVITLSTCTSAGSESGKRNVVHAILQRKGIDPVKEKMETTNKLIYMKQAQSKKEMKLMEENEKKIILMRHDMRHFLNNILNDLENNQNEHAIEYIHTLFDAIDQTVRKKYCLNDTVNMIMTSYENRMKDKNIDFHYHLDIPQQLSISDIDLTSILSNGLENAFKAVMSLENERFIELNMQEKCGKLLISIENNYLNEPIFIDGIPISKEKDHGFGTQSIAYTVEKLHGNCQFSTHQHHFKLRVVI